MYDDEEEFGEHPSTTNNVDKSELTLTLPCLKNKGSFFQDTDDD